MSNYSCRLLMCRPSYYGLNYSINPWMDLNKHVDLGLAQKQWQNLHHLIIRIGGYVEYVEPYPGQPDMVFTANAGLVYGNKVVVSRFLYRERQGEEPLFQRWFEQQNYETIQLFNVGVDIPNEGAGDALFSCDDTLYCGYGYRTSIYAYNHIQDYLGLKRIICLKLTDGRFYHLDTCFCPLLDNKAIYYPGAFSSDSVDLIKKNLDVFAVPEDEAKKFACNAVLIKKSVILPMGCPKTEEALSHWGYDVYSVNMSEYIKAGGACRCLTLEI